MKIQVIRIAKKSTYTIGRLYVDGKYISDTLEDTDRMLDDSMSETEINRRKIKHQTAIPTGKYRVVMNVTSDTFGSNKFYKDLCNGKLPRLKNVKGYQGILIHCGNTPSDTSGCILVGENKVAGKVINSKAAFRKLYSVIKNGKDIMIEIKRNYK